ncbi:DL-endopeptidase inhibitor IseA family protein [Clostridium neuense]|uniref:DL-endopeptidase inhibitor IseA family protein n=1 Tax=Clostridium neuense TaxID=1728934 RepID=A0ABW8TKK7_9CLOT
MSFNPKKKIIIISLSIILVLIFAFVYVNFFKSQKTSSTNKATSTKLVKPKVSPKANPNSASTTSPANSSKNTENAAAETSTSKPNESTVSSRKISSNIKQQVSPKPIPKPSASIISDNDIKALLYNGDIAVRNFYTSAYLKNSNHNSPTVLDNKYYSEMIPSITSYSMLQNFMRKNYNLNSYYTQTFIRKFMDETFRYINGKYYILVGNYGLMLQYDNTFKVISRSSNGNLLYLKISGYADGDTTPSTMNVVLYHSGTNWLIYKFNDWGIQALAN